MVNDNVDLAPMEEVRKRALFHGMVKEQLLLEMFDTYGCDGLSVQEQMKAMIRENGGLKFIVDELEAQRKISPIKRKMVFTGVVGYLWLLHKTPMDIEKYALSNKKVTWFVIRYFQKWGEIKKCSSMIFVANMLRYKMAFYKDAQKIY